MRNLARTLKLNRNYRRILYYLNKREKSKDIIKNLKITKRNYYKKLNTLEKYKYITKKRVGKILNIELQPKALKEFTMFSRGTERVHYKINIHDIWISFKILRKPRNWNTSLAERMLEAKSIEFNEHDLNNWKGIYFNYANVTVRLTPNKVMFHPPEVVISTQDDIEEAKNNIVKYVYNIVPKIESIFNISLTKPDKVNASVSSQHIALVNNLIAKYFSDKGIKLCIKADDGRNRIIVDKSRGPAELECIHKAYAEEDAIKLNDFINDTVTGRFNHREIQHNLNVIVENQLAFSQNLKTHIKVLKDINKAIKELREVIKNEKNTIKSSKDS